MLYNFIEYNPILLIQTARSQWIKYIYTNQSHLVLTQNISKDRDFLLQTEVYKATPGVADWKLTLPRERDGAERQKVSERTLQLCICQLERLVAVPSSAGRRIIFVTATYFHKL